MVSRRIHRPEFQEGEAFAELAQPFLAEKYWSAGSELYGGGNQEQQRQESKQQEKAANHIHASLYSERRPLRIYFVREVRIKD